MLCPKITLLGLFWQSDQEDQGLRILDKLEETILTSSIKSGTSISVPNYHTLHVVPVVVESCEMLLFFFSE